MMLTPAAEEANAAPCCKQQPHELLRQYITQSTLFQNFLSESGIAPDSYDVDASKLPRHFRISPSVATDASAVEELLGNIAQETGGVVPESVSWADGFYALPQSVQLSALNAYKRGQIYGLDVSSGYAVLVLDPKPGDSVLDLCCAPGAKFCMIADILGKRGTLTGVDISSSRLASCRGLLYKYNLLSLPTSESEKATQGQPKEVEVGGERALTWRCRLFEGPGEAFSVGPFDEFLPPQYKLIADSAMLGRSTSSGGTKRFRPSRNYRALQKKRQKTMNDNYQSFLSKATEVETENSKSAEEEGRALYDRVLVDAECTHDGSIKHLLKAAVSQTAWQEFEEKRLTESTLREVESIQRGLIRNGFRLLAPGGVLVYSTCSLSQRQNEDIVAWLCSEEPLAETLPILTEENSKHIPAERGRYLHTIRFTPKLGTSGLFVAKIQKRERKVADT